MKTSPELKSSLTKESNNLGQKIELLRAFVVGDMGKLPQDQRELLLDQYEVMVRYRQILNKRLKLIIENAC